MNKNNKETSNIQQEIKITSTYGEKTLVECMKNIIYKTINLT